MFGVGDVPPRVAEAEPERLDAVVQVPARPRAGDQRKNARERANDGAPVAVGNGGVTAQRRGKFCQHATPVAPAAFTRASVATGRPRARSFPHHPASVRGAGNGQVAVLCQLWDSLSTRARVLRPQKATGQPPSYTRNGGRGAGLGATHAGLLCPILARSKPSRMFNAISAVSPCPLGAISKT